MDEAQTQFIGDAQEIVERLSRDLERLRAVHSQGRQRRELAARIFRRVHTLKGSAASLELKSVSRLAHEFEGVLDGVRLGRIAIDEALLDAFEDATNAIAQALVNFPAEGDSDANALIALLHTMAATSAKQGTIASGLRAALPTEIAQALSEYDLQHAREAVREGARLFIISAHFEIETFDERFRALSKLLGQSGEIIATIPGGPAAAEEISFRLLYAAELVSQEIGRRTAALGRVEVGEVNIEPSQAAVKVPVENRTALRGLSTSVRVELDQLEELISDAGELFHDTNHALLSRAKSANQDNVATAASSLRQRFLELEERLIKLRLVPLAELLQRAAARGRRIAQRQLGKEVEFEILPEGVGIDKSLADAIADPLLHLVRNAVGHGIEEREERIAAGKSAAGTVKLAAFSEGSRIYISVSDDGRGVHPDRVAAAASRLGIAAETTRLTMDQCLRLIFRPGFSTTKEVSELSGRGIGLDVVDRAMEQAGGEVRVATEPGAGTTFAMILPAALALVETVIVRSDNQFYCIESARVADRGSLDEPDSTQMSDNGFIDWRGERLPLLRGRELLGQSAGNERDNARAVIVWQALEHRVGPARGRYRFVLVFDAIVGQQETLVRSLGRHSARWPGVSGAAELLDGQVALVLNVEELLEAAPNGQYHVR